MATHDFANFLLSLSNKELNSALLSGAGIPERFRPEILGTPDDSIQIATAGKTGNAAIMEAIDFSSATMLRYRFHVGNSAPRVLDFGCGWGRVTRAFLRFSPSSMLTGVDVRKEAIDLARSLTPRIRFEQIGPRPPANFFADESFDLVVGYSVFSHLSEDVARAWIDEFARIVAKGGLACITTRPKAHLVVAKSNSARSQELCGHAKTYATMIKDYDIAISRYDSGEFVYVPTGGGGCLSKDFYGEAIIPKPYVEKHWQNDFDLVEWIDKFSDIGAQPIIVLRRK
jgi:SAM-dependent methyltransferase